MANILSITNSKGRQVSLLNDDGVEDKQINKRKHHCTEPGCHKSFTTSGHLARHNRIHTGEKNFHCLYPGCPSRFSRQDNMMQHYRTHISSRSRLHYYYHYNQFPYRSVQAQKENYSSNNSTPYSSFKSIKNSSPLKTKSSSLYSTHYTHNPMTPVHSSLPPLYNKLNWSHHDHTYQHNTKPIHEKQSFYFEGYV